MLLELLELCNCDPQERKPETDREQGASSGNKVKMHYMRKGNITSLILEEFVNKEKDVFLENAICVINSMSPFVFGTYHIDKLLILCNTKELKCQTSIVALGDIIPALENSGENSEDNTKQSSADDKKQTYLISNKNVK